MHRKVLLWRRKIERIRHPALRICIGVALLAGGVLWFLPVLGIWMVPLGIAVLAIDIPWMRPVNQVMRRWIRAGVDAMQRSSIGWVSGLGRKLSSSATHRHRSDPSIDRSIDRSTDASSDGSVDAKITSNEMRPPDDPAQHSRD